MPNCCILLVEDDDEVASLLVDHLEQSLEAEVRRVSDAESAFEAVLEQSPDLIVADLLLPGGDGLSLVRRIRSIATVPVILVTGQPTLGRAVAAMRLGVVDLLVKPFDLGRLSRIAQEAMDTAKSQRRLSKRAERMRKVAKRAIEQRDHLRDQLDLVCKDLVVAHRTLAERVHAIQVKSAGDSSQDEMSDA